MTEIEFIEFKHRVESSGYKSMSKYIRDRVLKGKTITTTYNHNENTYTALKELTTEVKKIGVNYNQLIRNYNANINKISSYGTEKLMKKIYKMTVLLVENVSQIKNQITTDNDNTTA